MSNANRKPLILIIIAVLTFTIAVVGASFAYFTAQKETGSSANAVVKTETTDALTFQAGNPINIEVNQANFGNGAGNKSYETTATVNLRANTGNNTATYNFYVYLDIITNNFDYTTGTTKTPELIMTLTDQNGNEVKTLEGYNYVTSGGVSGFDVTRTSGLVKLVDNKVITTTSNVSETWKVKITFINLSCDQQKNTGKTFTGEIKIQKEMIPTIATACVGQNMASCIKTNYELDHGIDYHTATLANGANDNSYRYSGANPNNYVCFGSDEVLCPRENLYRIIGVFDNKIKLIKNITNIFVAWDSTEPYDNSWEKSELNLYLNNTFVNTFSQTWKNKIFATTWKVGGIPNNIEQRFSPKNIFYYEAGKNSIEKTFVDKIGLIYLSDYGFSSTSSNWQINLQEIGNSNTDMKKFLYNSWMNLENHEWTITKVSNQNYSWHIFVYGGIIKNILNYKLAVRPTFYTNSSTNLTGGNGTEQNPYIIS